MTVRERTNSASNLLERNMTWLSQSDGKAVAVLAFQAGFFAFLTSKVSDLRTVFFTDQPRLLQYVLFLALCLFAFFLARSTYFAFRALLPDVISKSFSHIYFGNIAQLDENQFVQVYKKLTDEELLDETLHQVAVTSKIVAQKYSRVKEAIMSLGLSFIFWAVVIAISAYVG